MKIAIFLPNWIGDVVMATPTLRAVRNAFPEAQILGIQRPYVSDVLAGTGLLDRTLFFNPRGKEPSQRGWRFLRQLRAERCDTALLLTNSLRTGVLAWLSGARRRIGFARDGRGWLLTDRVEPKPRSVPHPVLGEYVRLAERLGCSAVAPRIELAVEPADQTRLDQFWESVLPSNRPDNVGNQQPSQPHGMSSSSGYVCLNTGGAFGRAKNWPRESFVELARRVADELGRVVLIACGPSERDDARWISTQANHPRIFSLAGVPLSIGLTKAAVRGADLLVTTDSGPRHFAAAFGTPVVTLFGPTHIAWSETDYERAEHVQLKLECGPCQQRDCPLQHHRCMKDLTVNQVFSAVRRQLDRYANRSRVA